MKKRFLNLFLALILVVCVLPMAVWATECDHPHKIMRFEKEATCEEDGISKAHIYCPDCMKCMTLEGGVLKVISSPVIPATGHTWENGACTVCKTTCEHTDKETVPGYASTCTKQGRTDGEKCADCGKVLKSQYKLPLKNHVFKGKETIVKEATCTEKGSKTIQCKTCTETTTVAIDMIAHDGQGYGEKAATCVEAGHTAGTKCKVCDKILDGYKTIPATGEHNYNKWVKDIKAATCTEKAVVEMKCATCDATKEVEVGASKGHDPQGYAAKEATCVEDGRTEGTKCKVCGIILSGMKTIPATGEHRYSTKLENVSPATCTEKEVNLYKCRYCDKTEEVAIGKPLGHKTWDKEKVEPTCTVPGREAGKQCETCKEFIEGGAEIPATGEHKYNKFVKNVTPATCTEKKVNLYKCATCDDTKELPAGEPLGHSEQGYGEKAPTCVEAGHTAGYKCAVCNVVLSGYEPIAATGEHHYKFVKMLSPATCTEARVDYYECEDCDATLTKNNGNEVALKHWWKDEGTVTKKPTCEEEGTEEFKCRRCDAVDVRPIEKLRCVITTIEAVAPTCNKPGATAGTKCDSCGDGWACAACKEKLVKPTEVAALGHDMVLGETIKKATCTKDGKGIYNCSRCGYDGVETVLPALGHDPVETELWDATCTKDGITETVCSRCSTLVRERIPATGHTEEVVPAVAATCTATGLTEGKKCTTCNAVLTAQEEVAMIDHAWVEKTGVSATCTTDGYTAYKECSVCGLTEGKEVIPAAHTFVEGSYKCTVCDAADPMCEHENGKIETVASTCTVAGTETFTCDDCGYQFVETLEKAAHETEVQNTAATCTAPGETRKVCTVCNQVLERIEIPMVAHRFVDGACTVCGTLDSNSSTTQPGSGNTGNTGDSGSTGNSGNAGTSGCSHDKSTVINPATCTTAGYEMVTCATCNKVVSKTLLPALGHTNNTQITEPTCTKNGVKIVTCDRCDKFDYEVLPATGRHNYVDGICSSCKGTDPSRYTKDFQDVQIVGGTGY